MRFCWHRRNPSRSVIPTKYFIPKGDFVENLAHILVEIKNSIVRKIKKLEVTATHALMVKLGRNSRKVFRRIVNGESWREKAMGRLTLMRLRRVTV